jgi:hypothetical protein
MLIKDIRSKKDVTLSTSLSITLFERFVDFINACIKDLDIILPLIDKLDKQLFQAPS